MDFVYILVPMLPAMAILTVYVAEHTMIANRIKGNVGNPKPRPPTDLENKQ